MLGDFLLPELFTEEELFFPLSYVGFLPIARAGEVVNANHPNPTINVASHRFRINRLLQLTAVMEKPNPPEGRSSPHSV